MPRPPARSLVPLLLLLLLVSTSVAEDEVAEPAERVGELASEAQGASEGGAEGESEGETRTDAEVERETEAHVVASALSRAARPPWKDDEPGRSAQLQAGLDAAARLGDAAAFLSLVEASRGRALLVARQWREVLASVQPSTALRRERAASAKALREAEARRREARQTKRLATVRSARQALEKAKTRLAHVEAAVRIEALRAVVTSGPADRVGDDAASTLTRGEAYVAWHLGAERTFALLLVAGREPRLVDVGPTTAVVETLEGVDWSASAEDLEATAVRLRELLITPLRLPGATTRLLVSPDGLLRRHALGWILPDLDIVYIPSLGYVADLRRDRVERGYGILAVGDVVYDEPSTAPDGRPLPRLPSTRREALGAGTTVLLQKEATREAIERAFAGRRAEGGRWRALHVAAHGWADGRHPGFSALALTPTADSDGRWTAYDILGLTIPADLVVLSTTSSADGERFDEFQTPPLPAAFLAGGASAVLGSTDALDDDATRKLMEWFHALWNPAGEREGMTAAKALRKAQANLRAQPRWRHPRFWAPWVLWGAARP